MSKAISPFLLDRIIELEPKRGCIATARYSGRDLVQMIKFISYRDPDNPEDKTEIRGIASDSHYQFEVRFDPEATTRIERASEERLTSHLRCILSLETYTLELFHPSKSHSSHAQFSLRLSSWSYLAGSPQEPVYHPQANLFKMPLPRRGGAGEGRNSIDFPDTTAVNEHLRPQEYARWVQTAAESTRSLARWINKIQEDPVPIGWEHSEAEIERKRKEAMDIEISNLDESFAKRPLLKIKVEDNGFLLPASSLKPLLKPDPDPMSIVGILVDSYLSGSNIDYVFQMAPKSTAAGPAIESEDPRTTLTREAHMREDLKGLKEYKMMQPGRNGKMEEKYWDWEQADRCRRQEWFEKWVEYEDDVSAGQVGGDLEMHLSGPGSTEMSLRDEPSPRGRGAHHSEGGDKTAQPLQAADIAMQSHSSGDLPLPWSPSPPSKRQRDPTRRLKGSSSPTIARADSPNASPPRAGSARRRPRDWSPVRDPSAVGRVFPAPDHPNIVPSEGAAEEEELNEDSMEIRRPSVRVARSQMTQTRRIDFRDKMASSPASGKSFLGDEEIHDGSSGLLDRARGAATGDEEDKDPDDDMGIGGSMVLTQAYAHAIFDDIDEDHDSAEGGEHDATAGLEQQDDGADDEESPQQETATSDEVIKESLEENGPVIFPHTPKIPAPKGTATLDDHIADQEAVEQLAAPLSQSRSSVLVDESDEEARERRMNIGKSRSRQTSSASATPQRAAKPSTLIPSSVITPHLAAGSPSSSTARKSDVRKRRAEETGALAGEPLPNLPILDLKGKKRMRKSLEGPSRFTPLPLHVTLAAVRPAGAPVPAGTQAGRRRSETPRSRTSESSVMRSETGSSRSRRTSEWPKRLELDLGAGQGMTLEELLK